MSRPLLSSNTAFSHLLSKAGDLCAQSVFERKWKEEVGGGGGRCVEKGMGKAKELLKRERLWIYFFLSLKKGSVRERE